MNYINLEKNITKVWLILITIVSIALAIATIVSYTYLTGFLLGSIISISFFYANNFFLEKLLSTKRKFKTSFLISMLKFLLTTVLLVGVLISVIFINKAFNQNNGMLDIDGIFNFFTVFAGLLTFQVSIIIYNILIVIVEKRKKEQDG